MREVVIERPRLLIEAMLPVPLGKSKRLAYDTVLVLGFSALIALSARVAIPLPFTPVPITGQTFAVLLTGAALGARRGAVALLLYLLEGAIGLPVFAGGAAGFEKLVGPTGGYLVSYPVAAFVMGRLAERGWDRTPKTTFAAMLLTSPLILGTGMLWLSFFVGGLRPALVAGLLPFLPGDVVKAALAAGVLPTVWNLTSREDAKSQR